MKSLPKIVAIVGPTASGKTSLGVFLAKKFGGEIISADSRQVYRRLNLGTGKEGEEDKEGKDIRWLEGIPQHLIDIRNPEERFNVAEWKKMAEVTINDILFRNRLPIVVGGTGLYIDALVENYQFGGRNNKKKNPKKFDVLQIGTDLPREQLYHQIDKRIDSRLKEGMVKEVRGLLDSGVNADWLISLGLEYKYLTQHLLGEIADFDEAVQKLKFASHAFARRQLIWLRHHGDIKWISDTKEAMKLLASYL